MPSVSVPDGLYEYASSLVVYGIGAKVGDVAGCSAAIWPDNAVPDTLWIDKVYMAKIPVIHSARTPVPDKFIRYEVGVGTNDVSHLARILKRVIEAFEKGDYSQCSIPKEPPKTVVPVVNKTPEQIAEEKQYEPLPVNIHEGEFISICISLQNRGFYLDGLIENLYAQEYDLKKIELCVADYGSKDNISEILQKHASKFAQVKYMKLDREKAGIAINGNHPGLDVNAMVAQMATFEKIIHIDPEVRLANIGTLRRISSALDMRKMVIHIPCQKLAEGVEWRPNPQYGVHEVFGAPISLGGMYCIGFNKSYFLETGGFDERLFGGNNDEVAYFHHWHQKHSTWNSVREDYQCYHLYHTPTRDAQKPTNLTTITLLKQLINGDETPNGNLGNNYWQLRPVLSGLNILRNGDMPAVSVVVPYMDSKYRHRILKMVIEELRKRQTVKNIEIIISEVGVSNKGSKFQHPDKKLYNRTSKWIKGEAVSYGVVEATSDLVIMWDADIITRPDFIENVCAEKAKGAHSMQLGGDLYKLSEKAVVDMANYNKLAKVSWWAAFFAVGIHEKIGDTAITDYGRTFPTYPGGIVAFTKDLYIAIGGISERYSGWGYEDKLFQDILDYASPKHVRRPDIPLIHIHHPQGESDDKNSKLYAEDRQATLPKVIKANKHYFKTKYLLKEKEKVNANSSDL